MSTDAFTAAESGTLVPMSFPGARRFASWIFWVVLPLLSLGALALAISGIAQHLGDRPDGTRGTYIANRTCVNDVCLVGGTFVSDDGRTVVASLLGDPRWATGSQHRVVYDGNGSAVLGISQWDPTPSVLAAVGAGTYLSVVGFLALAARRRSDSESAAADEPLART
ncbi:MAG: hypothetical protein JWO63_1023 [Frankiales bacterium]|nr:hypothetical protein [Frankiales bacterium]